MNTKHTPGTLTADWMMAGYGREARRMETLNAEGYGTIGLAYSPEDARRFVAVWNACQGLSTEQLEAMAGSGTIKSALDDPMGFAVARAYLNGENLEDLVRRAIVKLEGK